MVWIILLSVALIACVIVASRLPVDAPTPVVHGPKKRRVVFVCAECRALQEVPNGHFTEGMFDMAGKMLCPVCKKRRRSEGLLFSSFPTKEQAEEQAAYCTELTKRPHVVFLVPEDSEAYRRGQLYGACDEAEADGYRADGAVFEAT